MRLEATYDVDTNATARGLGITTPTLHRLRSLLHERARAAWDIGDLLHSVYGAPGRTGVTDGSYERLQRLADELDVSRSWLTSVRACSAAWPRSERRPTVSWACHRRLAPFPDRVAKLDAFVEHCRRQHISPSFRVLGDWLDGVEPVAAGLGRPRVEETTRLERRALALETDALQRLVERLQAALHSRLQAPAAA